jgi:chemotaxis protein MotB
MSAGHGHSKKRHKGGHEEEHENAERWLLTYADMITLLMVLFIVLFAISQVDQKKFAALKNGLAAGFGATTVFTGGTGTLQDDGMSNSAFALNPDLPSQPLTPNQQKAVQRAVQNKDRAQAEAQLKAAQKEAEDFKKLQRQIQKALANGQANAGVAFRIDERGLIVTIVTSSVVFAGDRAELLPAGQRILNAIGPALLRVPNHVEVDGHTNQLPVPTRHYPTAWELSTARACMVVRYLIAHNGLPASRMSAAGYAGERPLYPPSDPRAPTLNRRVEIIVASRLPAVERALLPVAAR